MKEKGNFTLVSLVSLIVAIFFGCQKQENNKNPTRTQQSDVSSQKIIYYEDE